MGGRYPSTDTPHTKQIWRRESVTTFPVGAAGEGEVNAAPTPTATTPCRDAAMAWIAASERPRVARPVSGGDPIGCPPTPCPPPPPWYDALHRGVGMVNHWPPSSRRLRWWGWRPGWLWGLWWAGNVPPPPWYVPVWGKMSPAAQNFTGVPLGGTAYKGCSPNFPAPPPWRQFVHSMGGRGQVPACGRPISGRKHLDAPQMRGVIRQWGPDPPVWNPPLYPPPPPVPIGMRRGGLAFLRPAAKNRPSIPLE